MPDRLPSYVDEHAVRISAPREVVWACLERYAITSLGIPPGNPLAKLLGTEPQTGFEVSDSVPGESLELSGRHRFSTYRLRFELADAPAGSTQLRAQTYAVFPGVTGEIYRTLVIRTRLHVVATRQLLRSIGRASLVHPPS